MPSNYPACNTLKKDKKELQDINSIEAIQKNMEIGQIHDSAIKKRTVKTKT